MIFPVFVQIETSAGSFELELYNDKAPKTVYNFVELSKLGLDSEFSLTISRRHKSGIHGMHVDVEPKSETERNEQDILELVNTADLSDKVKALAASLVASIAIAESSSQPLHVPCSLPR